MEKNMAMSQSLSELYKIDGTPLVEINHEKLKTLAAEAFERLASDQRSKLELADWIILGTELSIGQDECKQSGRSYPAWCAENGFDWQRFGSKGKGLIYSAPEIARKPEIIMRVNGEGKALNNPEHIVYEYKKILKEERAALVADQRNQMRLEALDIPPSDRWRVFNTEMQNFESDKKYDWIITDPPYPREHLHLFGVLAERSKGWLAPGGLMVVMSGQQYFAEVMRQMSSIDYYWIAAYLTPGQPTPLRHVNVNTTWKPLVIFSPNGDYKGPIFGDVFTSECNDKDHHKWGQSESGMFDIVSKLCLPGQSILDPFMGAGTTGVAALRHGCLFDGVELLEENCEISKVRLHKECE